MSDEQFIEKYEELLNKGYCDCNEMNCLDNDVPTKILNIVKGTKLEAKQLLEENQELKKQLGYLHSGEYLNQLRFERNMLQDVVDKMEVSKEDKKFIDMTHRNTELLEENRELKKQLSNSHQIEVQQKEFIEWLEDKLNMCDGFLDTIKSDLEEISYAGRVSGKTYIATQIMKNETAMKCYEEVLSKYKQMVGGNNDQ